MSEKNNYLPVDLQETKRERGARRGHISTLHPWWTRRSLVTARAAVYCALVSDQERERDFLRHLCTYPPAPGMLESARQRVLRKHSGRVLGGNGAELEIWQPDEQARIPRVLDMFAGGGSIPLEVLRLGGDAYGFDLNPVAYIIELCTLRFPQLYNQPSKAFCGSNAGQTWAGLSSEILYWSRWVQEHVASELSELYTKVGGASFGNAGELSPQSLFWSRTVRCPNPACGAEVPLSDHILLSRQNQRQISLTLEVNQISRSADYQVRRYEPGKEPESSSNTGSKRRGVVCPFCDTSVSLDYIQAAEISQQLMGMICSDAQGGEHIYGSTPHFAAQIASNEEMAMRKLKQFSTETSISLPQELLSQNQVNTLPRYGFTRYQDLFTPRQLLLLMTYIKHAHAAHSAMLELGISEERAKAITSYQGLMISNLARFHSAFSTWNHHVKSVQPCLFRNALPFTSSFVELYPFVEPFDLISFAQRAAEVVQECADVERPATIFCGSATRLPFEAGFFDAIITEPPYYDTVPYADFSDFFYIWLKRGIGHLHPPYFADQLSPKRDEVVVAADRYDADKEKAQETYQRMMEATLQEAHRVLKQDRTLTVIYSSRSSKVLQIYLDIAQKAGFELLEVSRFEPDDPAGVAQVKDEEKDGKGGDFVLRFRKSTLNIQPPHASADAEAVLQLAESNRPNLYQGLAQVILENVSEADIEAIIPGHYAGSLGDKLSEYIAACEDPEQFLIQNLGILHLRAIAKGKGWLENVPTTASPASIILGELGFNIPAAPQEGVVQAIDRLHHLASQVTAARDRTELPGYLLTGMALVELMLHRSAWAWAQILFGATAKEHMVKILGEDKPLDRLTMGDIQKLFCELPDYVAQSPYAKRAVSLFGRVHIYKPKKHVKDLDQLVAIRNRIAHNKGQYSKTTSLEEMQRELGGSLRLAARVLLALKEGNAIPLLARPVREARDVYERRSVTLQIEDGTVREIYVTNSLVLGQNYLYLGDRSNPKPVDPIVILLSDIEPILH